MKYTIIATETLKGKTADYSKRHGVEEYDGTTIQIHLIEFAEVQKGKKTHAVADDLLLKILDSKETYAGLGVRSEEQGRKKLAGFVADNAKLARW